MKTFKFFSQLNIFFQSGGFAVVKKVSKKGTGELFALKIVDKTKLKPKQLNTLTREINIMHKLSHPNIVHLYEVIETEETLYLVLELYSIFLKSIYFQNN